MNSASGRRGNQLGEALPEGGDRPPLYSKGYRLPAELESPSSRLGFNSLSNSFLCSSSFHTIISCVLVAPFPPLIFTHT